MEAVALRNRLKEKEEEISQHSSKLINIVKHEALIAYKREEVPDDNKNWLTPELVSNFWLLKNGFDEAEALLKNEELSACSLSLDKLSFKVNEFVQAYPNTLLAVDMHRIIRILKKNLSEDYTKLWHKIVSVKDNQISIRPGDHDFESIFSANPKLVEFFVQRQFGDSIIKPLVNLELAVTSTNDSIVFKKVGRLDIDSLFTSIKALVHFCASLPEPLCHTIPHRWGTYLISELTRSSIPKLYADFPNSTKLKDHLKNFLDLEKEMKVHKWSKSNEISHFVTSLDSSWENKQRENYLMRLRNIYQKATPITDEQRNLLIAEINCDESEFNNDADGWDWDGDDEEEPSNETNDPEPKNLGSVVDLWYAYNDELHLLTPEPFLMLYRAITPTAYGGNLLWLYGDTLSFIGRINQLSKSADTRQLNTFANEVLHSYIEKYLEIFEYEQLPLLFASGVLSEGALAHIRTIVDEVAIDTNSVGGPDLRQSVVAQLLEQAAVYIIKSVEQMSDIGEEESQNLATMIAKLITLDIYFEDANASIPSWTKLDMLKTILMSNLAVIDDLYERGMLADFSKEELVVLVEALFVDSSNRNKLLKKVSQ